MSRRCAITGRGPQVGHTVSHAHNITLRRWNVNLQKIRVLINGKPVRIKVSTRAIKSGLIERPPVVLKARRPKEARPVAVKKQVFFQEEEPTAQGFFSDSSITSRLFKPRPKTEPTGPIVGVDIPDFDTPNPIYGEELTPRAGGSNQSRPAKPQRGRR